MMRSMFSAVSGLRIHQSRMDVIGNNIANVNTIGFKSSRVTFNEMFSQTLQGASAPNPDKNIGGTNPLQIGLGANIASIDTIMTEGAAERTDNPLDLKIEGDGFFVVSNNSGNKFTRAGAFKVDKSGYIVTPEGLRLMGWKANADGKIEKGKVKPVTIFDAKNMYSEPQKTEALRLEGNINSKDTNLIDDGKDDEGGILYPINFYDNLGYKYTAELAFEAVNGEPNTYQAKIMKVTDSNNKLIADATDPTSGVVWSSKDSSGTYATISGGNMHNKSNILKIHFDPVTGKFNTTPSTFAITGLNTVDKDPALADHIDVDFSELTMFAGKTNINPISGNKDGTKTGREAGVISGFNVGPDGKIQGKYTNGDTKLLGQIVIADFRNPAGLQKAGNNLFDVTPNSGDFDGVGQEVTANGGSFNSGVLEMSNVDLSKQFTDMITTQRGFQANSRIITASDEMLQELVNLKR